MPLQSSAARTSSITSKSKLHSKSPIKKFQKDVKKILPTQNAYQDQLKKKKSSSSPSPSNHEIRISDYNVHLDYQLDNNQDLITAIDTILDNRWSESTKLHNKFQEYITHPYSDLEGQILSMKNVSNTAKIELLTFRKKFPSLVVITTLYSIFNGLGNTFVDKLIELNIRQGKVKKLIISNASPIINRSLNQYQSGKISYGYENMEVLVKSDEYYELLSEMIVISNDKDVKDIIDKYMVYMTRHYTDMYLRMEEFNDEEIKVLINKGLVTLTSNHLSEIETLYRVSYPGCGVFLKLINEGRAWITKTLTKQKDKQLLETDIWNKWQGYNTLTGDSKLNNFRKPFYGYDLNWILSDCLGSGIVEGFNTPVGRGWKLTGKI
ncbi:unnamed protein product [Candida verbasci]|uniref:Uncharacterized protein n=1 Tax=Candida verbasci TaxID=1227364 RepID=A0A9W4XLF2_9ASCO|nr:unnamed protein product [Candida verbasci]